MLCSLFVVSSSKCTHNTHNFWTPALFVAVHLFCGFFLVFLCVSAFIWLESNVIDVCLNLSQFFWFVFSACLLARVFYCVCVLNMRQNGSWYFRQTDRSVILLKRESKHNKRMCNKQESIVFRNVSVVAMLPGLSAGYIYVRSFNDRNAQNARPNCLERSHWTFGIYYVCNS